MSELKDENALVLELCKFVAPDKEKIETLMEQTLNWPYILGQLLFHRMGGAAYYVLRECGLLGKINREVRNSLKIIYDSGKTKSESFKTALSELAEIMNSRSNENSWQNADFPYSLLKGAYLVSLYPNGLRTSNDIDVLINQEDISKLEALLKSAGFTQGNIRNGVFLSASRAEILSSRMNRGETVPFIKQINLSGMEYLEIDVNFSLDHKTKQSGNAVTALLKNATPLIKTENGNLLTLSPVDFLIHLCCHLYKEAAVYAWVEMERDLSLYKFADIYLLLNKWTDSGLYTDLAVNIGEYGLNRECYYAFLRTKDLFSIENAKLDELLINIKPNDTDYLTEVIRPDQNKTYRYDIPFHDWIFTSGRKGYLYEVANGNS